MMTDLSPAAQAIEDAYFNADGFGYRNGLAAALRAAVANTQQRQYNECWICDANELLAIAAELEEV
jgi:hypothetical protein